MPEKPSQLIKSKRKFSEALVHPAAVDPCGNHGAAKRPCTSGDQQVTGLPQQVWEALPPSYLQLERTQPSFTGPMLEIEALMEDICAMGECFGLFNT